MNYHTDIDLVIEKIKLIKAVMRMIDCSPTAGYTISPYRLNKILKQLHLKLKKLRKEADGEHNDWE